MTYFYADRSDKKGNRLLTSYSNQKSAEKYGGADAEVTETLYRGELSEDNTKLKISDKLSKGPIVRSFMKNASTPANDSSEGKYGLWGKVDGRWSRTAFAFDTYGNANTMMKTLIGLYEAMLVLDTSEAPEPRSSYVPRGFDDL